MTKEEGDQRVWELYCSLAGKIKDYTWQDLFWFAVGGVSQFNAEMEQLRVQEKKREKNKKKKEGE